MSNGPIVVSGVHLELTEALKETVHAKVEKLLRHNPRIVRIHVELVFNHTRDHRREFAAQIRLELPGPDIVVREESDDLYKSIDTVVDKVDRQLRRRHRLEKEKRNHPHATDLGLIHRAC
jgi:putative sigma-54 modulation protein